MRFVSDDSWKRNGTSLNDCVIAMLIELQTQFCMYHLGQKFKWYIKSTIIMYMFIDIDLVQQIYM